MTIIENVVEYVIENVVIPAVCGVIIAVICFLCYDFNGTIAILETMFGF